MNFFFNGPSPDGRQYQFANDTGIGFNSYVPDNLKPLVDAMPVGTQITATFESKTSKKGATYTQATMINGQQAQKGGGNFGGKGRGYVYDPKRFCEAVCAAAIRAGSVSSPEQLGSWVRAAYAAISNVETQTGQTGAPSNGTQGAVAGAAAVPPNANPPY